MVVPKYLARVKFPGDLDFLMVDIQISKLIETCKFFCNTRVVLPVEVSCMLLAFEYYKAIWISAELDAALLACYLGLIDFE